MDENEIIIYWLSAGVAMLFAETVASGIGLLFTGCGALVVGMLLSFSLLAPDAYLAQAVIFCAATTACTIILWKPMKKLQLSKKNESYSNIIGETAIVGKKGVSKKRGGEVIWSGTVMKAKLLKEVEIENLESGAEVTINNVMGCTFIVTPTK